ncbi:ABC transporter substrate-binding protein [Phaeobacter sp.]|uniref:ABC transporter substrate-binding protein n=1 Tax=Phaeobacter sp. TaxID=1902409 RepID=UPI0025CCF8C2|nr:ABC transporter substrate-binding protein [Phaeobacter sp.]
MTRIDRRALFTSGAAAALLAATGAGLADTPRRGGVLRLAVPREADLMQHVLRGAVLDGLTEIGADGVLRPELAQQWTSSDDARVWQFDLRSDVAFHDGSPLTAEVAVAALLDRGDHLPTLQHMEATADHSLRLELSQSNPQLPYLLGDAAFQITQPGIWPEQTASLVGTGCYQVERVRPGRDFKLARVANHYKETQAGWVDSVELIVISDPLVRAEALRDGYVDVAALPAAEGLLSRGHFFFHPSATNMALAARPDVGVPRDIGAQSALDDGRIAERWWRV